jgi:acyl-CoA thioester hydrolase
MAGAPFRFESEQAIRWVDVDAAGVVNHAIYFSLVEQARFDYFRRLGLLAGDIPPFLLGTTTARYHRSGRVGMRLSVGVRTVRLGTKSFDMAYEVREQPAPGGAAGPLATVTATLVWVDERMKSCPIPPAARRALAAFEGIAEGAGST